VGTSRNDPSPDVPVWRRAKAILGNPRFSPGEQGAALWQAALSERRERLTEELSDPVLVRACALAGERTSASEALSRFDSVLFDARSASVTVEFARRALGRAALKRGGAGLFAVELFAEITDYYAARDIPSIVSTSNRVRTVSETIRLADELRGIVRQRIEALGEPGHRQREWSSYVRRALTTLRTPPG
jgi:hypothetical protein